MIPERLKASQQVSFIRTAYPDCDIDKIYTILDSQNSVNLCNARAETLHMHFEFDNEFDTNTNWSNYNGKNWKYYRPNVGHFSYKKR